MRFRRAMLLGIVIGGLLVPGSALATPGSGWLDLQGVRTGPGSREVVVSLPVGGASGEIGMESGKEQPTWGPASFDVDDGGRYWIVDGVNGRLVVVAPDGAFLRDVSLREPVVGALDVEVVRGHAFVLDLVAQPPAVREVDEEGDVAGSWEIPEEYAALGATGLRVDDGPSGVSISVQIAGAWEVPLTRGGKGVAGRRIPVQVQENHANIPAQAKADFATGVAGTEARFGLEKDWSDWRHATLTTYEYGRAVRRTVLESDAELGTLRFVGRDDAGNTYVYVEQMLDQGTRIEAYVKALDRTGAPVGIARVPVEEFATFPERFVRVTDAGELLVLVPMRDRVEIRSLELAEDTSAGLPSHENGGTAVAPEELSSSRGGLVSRVLGFVGGLLEPEEAHAIWSPLDANDRAWDYLYDSWYCSGANYSRSCGDYLPRYVKSSGKSYKAVPYCWGGFDTASQFNQDMKNGLDAGDTNTTGGKRWCTSGVDCSGFVSRCWGLGSKQSTRTLPGFAYSVSKSKMRLGDAYIRPGVHTMMFRYFTSGGAQLFEATKGHAYDRVVTHAWTTAELGSYGAYRYRNW